MQNLTFVIPIGPAHQALARRAIESVQRQTVPCDLLTMLDEGQLGPGVLRNRMLAQVGTEFVSFLDADDWVEPTFAEETLAEYQRVGGGVYVFTDWLNAQDRVVQAPCINGPAGDPISTPDRKPYCGGTWHTVTALIPTLWARSVGGFDEALPAVEDTDFFLKLCTTFHCGHRLARPLFHYSPGGGRALNFRSSADYQKVMGDLTLRYGGKMGCCGDKNAIVKPIGEKQPGDVLAMALWHGNHSEFGRVSKRHYPRISYPRTAWVDPADAHFSPNLWQLIDQQPVDQGMGLNSLSQIAAVGMATVVKQPYAPPAFEPPAPPVQAKPDVSRVLRLARKSDAKIDEPIFIFPEKDYPSYGDIRRLVSLSGFDAITTKQIDVFSRRPYIVVSPEPIPTLNGIPARVICWQLEYAGDYTENYLGFKGELWASDKAWADANGAKYVLMGSHPDLVDPDEDGFSVGPAPTATDVTMLGYMTPRRQAIKKLLSDLRWPIDYPGHAGAIARRSVLMNTRLMLHVHQHEDALYVAPQRIAIAAAYRLPVLSETIADPGPLLDYIAMANYLHIPTAVRAQLADAEGRAMAGRAGEKLHNYLCVERTFRTCVEEALKS